MCTSCLCFWVEYSSCFDKAVFVRLCCCVVVCCCWWFLFQRFLWVNFLMIVCECFQCNNDLLKQSVVEWEIQNLSHKYRLFQYRESCVYLWVTVSSCDLYCWLLGFWKSFYHKIRANKTIVNVSKEWITFFEFLCDTSKEILHDGAATVISESFESTKKS